MALEGSFTHLVCLLLSVFVVNPFTLLRDMIFYKPLLANGLASDPTRRNHDVIMLSVLDIFSLLQH